MAGGTSRAKKSREENKIEIKLVTILLAGEFYGSSLRFSPLAAMARASRPYADPVWYWEAVAYCVGSGYGERCE